MNEISHDQARRYIQASIDGLLDTEEEQALRGHLHTCESCREEADQLDELGQNLQHTFQEHWDSVPLPKNPVDVTTLSPEPWMPRLGRMTINLLLVVLWIWLYRAVFGYLRVIFSHSEFRTNQLLLGCVLILIFVRLRQHKLRPRVDRLPQIYWPGLALIVGGSVGYLLVERFLDINTFSASLFGLATYGLIGLWISPRRWMDSLPAALLLIGVLPFGDHLQTFVGYPMRVATAEIVQRGLTAAGIHSVGVDTILVLESGLAQIDLPCSGVKSLWTGMLFLIAATWLEKRSINMRWMGIAALVGGLLFLANVARVAVLVFVGQVTGLEMLAELVHVPLGVLAFLGVCGVSLLMLKQQQTLMSTQTDMTGDKDESSLPTDGKRPAWLAPSLAVLIAGMALLYQPRPQIASAQATVQWVFPTEMKVQVDPLSPALYAWVTQDGADSANRWDFTWEEGDQSIRGSLMLLTSDNWRGQHRPERCFEVQGQKVESSQTTMFAEDFPTKQLLLSRGPTEVSAVYWLQAGERVTDDFATRIWSDLTPEDERWVLVTILLDDVYAPDSSVVLSLMKTVRWAVADSLEGALP
jgi:exosortase O